jgi:magnesium transporter
METAALPTRPDDALASVAPPDPGAALTIFVHGGGQTRAVDAIDPAWLAPDSGMFVWADLGNANPAATRHLLSDVFHFHELSVEDAVGESHHPKVEPYDGYLYLILHGIDWNATKQGGFSTHDIDFFIGPNCLVTARPARSPRSRGSVPATASSWSTAPWRSSIASSTRWSTTTGPR